MNPKTDALSNELDCGEDQAVFPLFFAIFQRSGKITGDAFETRFDTCPRKQPKDTACMSKGNLISRPGKSPTLISPYFRMRLAAGLKKVRGRFSFFGKVADDPKGEKALEPWLEQKDDLLAGRTPCRRKGLRSASFWTASSLAKDTSLTPTKSAPSTLRNSTPRAAASGTLLG